MARFAGVVFFCANAGIDDRSTARENTSSGFIFDSPEWNSDAGVFPIVTSIDCDLIAGCLAKSSSCLNTEPQLFIGAFGSFECPSDPWGGEGGRRPDEGLELSLIHI